MQIDFERRGGFAGMATTLSVDTDSLPANEAYEIKELVSVANFFSQPANLTATAPGAADQFTYTLTVKDNGRQHTVETTDTSAPTALRPLLQRLTKMARSARA
ncbi:hypothetical protein XM38_021860 [Halomicronema hongdechloris C2206]|uniref:Uncharacterized protein n=1 Tax=Halomicronema hongdechloris C2206 TaxID=1641165 RepID=A0A1Z3HLQ9_9CYAN|nr:protealysin inhibitor emfourin [Halomicronema hongdechloris]ASC71234.1 hypothetical protein XM38_021860 [Halomicronema hongdechloris C2206]